MKTSTKIIIAALAILIGTLVFYDLGLRAEYLKGDFTDPHRKYVPLNYTGFDEIELKSSTAINIKLVQGPFRVMADPECISFVKITRQDNRLVINAVFSDYYRSLHSDFALLISCPKLTVFKADAVYRVPVSTVTDTSSNDFGHVPTVISGFNAGTLTISADHATNLVLENNRLDTLNALIGLHEKSRSNLTIGKNNLFRHSNVQILHNSYLRINNHDPVSFHYQLADSAMLLINGAAVKHNFKPY